MATDPAANIQEDVSSTSSIFVSCKAASDVAEEEEEEPDDVFVEAAEGDELSNQDEAELLELDEDNEDDEVFHSLPGLLENDSNCKATVITQPLDPLAESYRVIALLYPSQSSLDSREEMHAVCSTTRPYCI